MCKQPKTKIPNENPKNAYTESRKHEILKNNLNSGNRFPKYYTKFKTQKKIDKLNYLF